MDTIKTAVISGGSRGIGFEVCHQLGLAGYRIILTSQDPLRGEKALLDLRRFGIQADYYSMNVSQESEFHSFTHWLSHITHHVDLLVNNAGIFLDTQDHAPLSDCTSARLSETFGTNVFGSIYMTRTLIPFLAQSGNAQIINVSSMLGQLTDMKGGFPAYRLSKVALNGTTRIFSEELAAHNIRVNSICPGWCKTDLGSESAPKTAAQGASDIVWLATTPHTPNGLFFHNRTEVSW